jgi:hypothetical protein
MVSATVSRVVRFLGLSGVAEIVGDTASFPLGVLFPYSGDLRRVCTSYEAVREEWPEAASMLVGELHGETGPLRPEQTGAVTTFLASIATLHSRIAFAPGHAGASVGEAYRRACDASAR